MLQQNRAFLSAYMDFQIAGLQCGTHTSVFLCLINNLTLSEYGTTPQPSAAPVCQVPVNAKNYLQIL